MSGTVSSGGGIYADSVEGGYGAAFSTWLLKGVFPSGYREVQCRLEKSLTGSTSHPLDAAALPYAIGWSDSQRLEL